MIYEGTNEIQAIDLLQRKVLGDGAVALEIWHEEALAEAIRCEQAGLSEFAQSVRDAVVATRAAVQSVRDAATNDAECVARVADEFMAGFSHAMLAWAFAASARATVGLADQEFAAGKLERMRYGLQWLLPQAAVHWARVRGGAGEYSLPALRAEAA